MARIALLLNLIGVWPGLGAAHTSYNSGLDEAPAFRPLTCELDNNTQVLLHHSELSAGSMLLHEDEISSNELIRESQVSWEVKPSPGKGLGVFATALIKTGQRIMVEEPLFTIRPGEFIPGKGYEISAMVSSLDSAVASLAPAQRAEFHACHAHRLPGEEDSNMSIFRSNAYTLTDGTIAMFPKIARINHSCRPNTANIWSQASGLRIIWAARDIAPGEEVTVTYVPLLKTSEERQKRLAQYGFKCACDSCRDHSRTDPERVRMGRLLVELEERLERSTSNVANKKLLPKAIELSQMLEHEHMADYLANAYHLVAEIYLRFKDVQPAAEWSRKALQLHEHADQNSHASAQECSYLSDILA